MINITYIIGAIAFGLTLQIACKHTRLLINTASLIVLLTCEIFATLSYSFSKCVGIDISNEKSTSSIADMPL